MSHEFLFQGSWFNPLRFGIGAPDFILSVIRDGYRILFISTPPPHHYKNNSSALEEPGFVAEAISELICDNHVDEIFTSPDIANLLRLILDLRHINLHMFKQKFKCEGLHIIKIILSKHFYAFFFDLKARYHHVDIFPNHRKYLGIWWDSGTGYVRNFQFTILVHLSFHKTS